MLDVHPPHHAANTWRDFFIHIATIVVGLLIAVGLEQTVEAIHHHHQREQLDRDLREESANNLKIIAHDLQFREFERWYDDAATALATRSHGFAEATLTPLPCVPGAPGSDGSIRFVMPSEGVWTTARDNGIATLLPADEARIYFRRAILFATVQRFLDQLLDSCPRLNAIERRLAHRSADGRADSWTLTPAQSEEFGALASAQAALLKAMCFRLKYLAAFERDLLEGTHVINGAPLDSTFDQMLDPEDRPAPR